MFLALLLTLYLSSEEQDYLELSVEIFDKIGLSENDILNMASDGKSIYGVGISSDKKTENGIVQSTQTIMHEIIAHLVNYIEKGKTNGVQAQIFSKTQNDVISTNGYHYGIEVDGKVFDNIHTEGVDYNTWKSDFELPVGGTIESVPDTINN